MWASQWPNLKTVENLWMDIKRAAHAEQPKRLTERLFERGSVKIFQARNGEKSACNKKL